MFVPAPVVPMYFCTTDDLPEDIFTTPASRNDAMDILSFDVSNNVFAPGKELTEAEKGLGDAAKTWFVDLQNNPSDTSRANLSLQLACMVAWWMTEPPERKVAQARMPTLTLAADRARRAASQHEGRRKLT